MALSLLLHNVLPILFCFSPLIKSLNPSIDLIWRIIRCPNDNFFVLHYRYIFYITLSRSLERFYLFWGNFLIFIYMYIY